MLKIEDVKVGDNVVCVDIAEFSKIWRKSRGYDINKMENTSILEIGPYYFRLKGKFLIENMGFDEIRASLDCLKYFKKKEQSQYTFDDLIDVSTKAFKDGVLYQSNLVKGRLDYKADFNGDQTTVFDDANYNFESHINFIQSLYKETFVIETEEDLNRVLYELDPKITLENGEVIPFIFKCVSRSTLIFEDQSGRNCIPFVFLKGATVEQERGRDD